MKSQPKTDNNNQINQNNNSKNNNYIKPGITLIKENNSSGKFQHNSQNNEVTIIKHSYNPSKETPKPPLRDK